MVVVVAVVEVVVPAAAVVVVAGLGLFEVITGGCVVTGGGGGKSSKIKYIKCREIMKGRFNLSDETLTCCAVLRSSSYLPEFKRERR